MPGKYSTNWATPTPLFCANQNFGMHFIVQNTLSTQRSGKSRWLCIQDQTEDVMVNTNGLFSRFRITQETDLYAWLSDYLD